MKNHRIVEVMVVEAKDLLIRHFAQKFVNDPQHLKELIRDGQLDTVIPHFPSLNDPAKIAALFGEENLGEEIARANNATHVVIATGDYQWEVVFNIENMHPDNRWATSSTAVFA